MNYKRFSPNLKRLGLFLSACYLAVCPGYSTEREGAGEQILRWKDLGGKVKMECEHGNLLLTPLHGNAVRVQYACTNQAMLPEYVFLPQGNAEIPYTVKDSLHFILVDLPQLRACVNKNDGHVAFLDKNGRTLLEETVGGRSVTAGELGRTANWEVQQSFVSPADEYLYGTGQFQDGYLNIRGLSRKLTQLNTQISIPFILSNKGYGLLWHNYGLTYFNPADQCVQLSETDGEGSVERVNVSTTEGTKEEERHSGVFTGTIHITQAGKYALLMDVGQVMARKHSVKIDGQTAVNVNNIWLPGTTSFLIDLTEGPHTVRVEGVTGDQPSVYYKRVTDETVFRSPVAQCLDYTVFGGSADEVISAYRTLTGAAPLPPQWALGYIHCRERFNTQQELLETAARFRKERYPADVMVQDWLYWGKYGWNAMQFDEGNYPDPAAMVDSLHHMNLRLMISVWSKIDKNCAVGKAADSAGYYIPGTEWIDFFNPEAAGFYWQNFSHRLLKPYLIDAWWQDATEPENDDLVGRMVNGGKWEGERVRNIYPLFVNKTVYEGLRKDDPGRRAFILTRSGFSGMQRYGAATWSGDVGHDWETLRRQIAGGLNYMASGLPWWTYDAGGFFRPGDQYTNEAYKECFVRWLQTATFLPLLRVHGYMSRTEFWNYGETVEKIARQYLGFRYRMLPYLYSEAARITYKGSTLMRPFVFDFPHDKKAMEEKYEYMFGPSLLVAPVLQPGATSASVYLPQCEAGWVDFWTGKSCAGGTSVEVPVSLDKMPLFVRKGSILPLGGPKEHVGDKPDGAWEIRIYPGADAEYTVYEDEGDNYNYEKGAYATFKLKWNDKAGLLTVEERKGAFNGMATRRKMKIVKVGPGKGVGFKEARARKEIVYTGQQIQVKL